MEVGFLDLLDLVAQEIGAAGLFFFVLLQRGQGFTGIAPLGDSGAELLAQGKQFGVAVEEVDVLFGAQQAHVFALPMNIDQPARDLLEHLLGDGAGIDARDGAARAEDITREDELSIFRSDIVFM